MQALGTFKKYTKALAELLGSGRHNLHIVKDAGSRRSKEDVSQQPLLLVTALGSTPANSLDDIKHRQT